MPLIHIKQLCLRFALHSFPENLSRSPVSRATLARQRPTARSLRPWVTIRRSLSMHQRYRQCALTVTEFLARGDVGSRCWSQQHQRAAAAQRRPHFLFLPSRRRSEVRRPPAAPAQFLPAPARGARRPFDAQRAT